MSWVAVGIISVGAIGSGVGASRNISRQKDNFLAQKRKFEEKARAYRKQSIDTRNAYETRLTQTEQMQSFQLEALQKQKTFNTAKVASGMGGSGALANVGTTAHVVASEEARGQFALNSYTKKADYERENIRNKGIAEQSRFTDMANQAMTAASEAQRQKDYLDRHGDMMVFESMLSGGLGSVGSGLAGYQSAPASWK